MELGHLLFLHSLSQAEVKTEFHHCMSLVYVGGNLGAFFPSLKKMGEKRENMIHKHRLLGAALHPKAILWPSVLLILSSVRLLQYLWLFNFPKSL